MLQFSATRHSLKATLCSDSARSSVPTKQDIVPETLLKKRKSQEKEREARTADLQKKRAVSLRPATLEWERVSVMITIPFRD